MGLASLRKILVDEKFWNKISIPFLPHKNYFNEISEHKATQIKVMLICDIFAIIIMAIILVQEIYIFGFASYPVLGSILASSFLYLYLIILKFTGKHKIGATLILISASIATCITIYQEHLFETGNIYWLMSYIFFGVYMIGPFIAFVIDAIGMVAIITYIILVHTGHQFPFDPNYSIEVITFEGIKAAFMINMVTLLSYFYEKGRLNIISKMELLTIKLEEDLTKIQRIQRERDDVMSKLIHSEKLASLGEMAGGMAHEINNPLAIIDGTVRRIDRLMAIEPLNLDKIKSYLADIQKVTSRVVKIISGLRTFARDGTNDPFESINVIELLANCEHLCREKFNSKGIRLNIKIDKSNIIINCRRIQIEQVIINLLNNSYDAVTEQKEKWIEIKVKDFGDKVQIFVTDSGSGIPEEIRDKIMYPFFTTKPIGKGTGLGLSISRGIIENHNGSLNLNTQSSDTQFVITLPK